MRRCALRAAGDGERLRRPGHGKNLSFFSCGPPARSNVSAATDLAGPVRPYTLPTAPPRASSKAGAIGSCALVAGAWCRGAAQRERSPSPEPALARVARPGVVAGRAEALAGASLGCRAARREGCRPDGGLCDGSPTGFVALRLGLWHYGSLACAALGVLDHPPTTSSSGGQGPGS